jgi:hypothetical protein
MARLILALASVFVFAGTVSAETYKWIDDRGTINFTEDYSQIPKKYRKKVRVTGDVQAEQVAGESGKEEPGKDVTEKNPSATGSDSGKNQEKTKTMYGSKSEDEWKADFKKLNDQIDKVQGQIEDRRTMLDNPDSLTRPRYRGIEMEIKDLEGKLAQLKSNLSALDGEASMAGVPYDLRR